MSDQRVRTFLAAQHPYLADGGLETTMVFQEGLDLPSFAAFTLFKTAEGRAALECYFDRYIDVARKAGTGFLLDTATWRANAPWIERMGLSQADLVDTNRVATAFARDLRSRHETETLPIVVNGVVGPAGDGYAVERALAPAEAQAAHQSQVAELAAAGVDMVTAVTFTHATEAIGFLRATAFVGIPAAVSFTVETDGSLPSGQTLADAIAEVDGATDARALYYMVNCAHPDHFRDVFAHNDGWLGRIGGLRANASRLSHAELDAAEVLDQGNPVEFGHLHIPFLTCLPNLRVLGGCCGTDHRHVHAVGERLRSAVAA